jgi:hypothetical protein
MSDLPKQVDIHEEGPREGFQIEPGPIGIADRIKPIAVGGMTEEIVGHQLPGELIHAGSLDGFRRRAAA